MRKYPKLRAGRKMKRDEISELLLPGHGSEWSDREHEYEMDMFEDDYVVIKEMDWTMFCSKKEVNLNTALVFVKTWFKRPNRSMTICVALYDPTSCLKVVIPHYNTSSVHLGTALVNSHLFSTCYASFLNCKRIT
jgi:hypothetical protein